MAKAFLILLTVTLLTSQTQSENVFSENEEKDISDLVKSVMDCKKIPGLTLSVVKKGDTWTKGFGSADMATGEKVTEDTLFAIGSLGKGFTMVLLGNLLDKTRYYFTTKATSVRRHILYVFFHEGV